MDVDKDATITVFCHHFRLPICASTVAAVNMPFIQASEIPASRNTGMEEAMIVDKVSRNVENLRILLQDAMPNGQFDVIKRLVSSDCVTRRAGFANLYAATGGSIPERGNFLEWVKAGWKPLSAALGDQHMEVEKAVGQGDSAMMHYHMRVRNKGEFLGMPATGNVIEWQEIAIASFDDDGTIIDLWFMCEELKLAEGLGFTLAR